MTIKEIAETIIRMTGSTSQLVYQPLPTDDPKVRQPDITRARTLLGWEPKVTLEQGLDVDDRVLPPEARALVAHGVQRLRHAAGLARAQGSVSADFALAPLQADRLASATLARRAGDDAAST